MRIGVLNNGLHAEEAFKLSENENLHYLYVWSFPIRRIFLYDALIVPYHLDQIFLFRYKNLLRKYAERGGVLVILGATEETRKWFPFCRWERDFTTSIMFDKTCADGTLVFEGIDGAEELQFHGAYYAHGSLSGIPNTSEDAILARDSQNRPVVIIKRSGIKGSVLTTTLDPDYHATTAVPGPADELVSITHDKAQRLLSNIMNWTSRECAGKSRRTRYWRFATGLVPVVIRAAFALALYSFPIWGLLLSVYLYNASSSDKTFATVVLGSAVLSGAGSLASLFSVCQTWRAARR